MKKIGLVSVSIHNYGSLLQTYAMQKVLDNYGIDNDIILFKSDPVKQIYRVFNISFLKMKMKLYKRKIITRLKYPEIYSGSSDRDQAFLDFKANYCRFTQKMTSRDKLNETGRKYDAFVLGSDQVWNPANLEMDFYTLNFVPLGKTKIAYAPSFGVSTIPKKQIPKTKGYLERIQYISVREVAGQKIVKELIGRDVPVVCDPTALLTRSQWDEIKSDKSYTNGKYIFCYFLGSNPEHRRFAEKVKATTGYSIVALQHIDEFVKNDLTFGDVTPYDVGPQDFLNLIANAEIVLTDSFHGTSFSIYYHKRFFTFPRYKDGKTESTNSRVVSILSLMGLSDHLLEGNEDANEALKINVDWKEVEDKLARFREDSFAYLNKALKESGIVK